MTENTYYKPRLLIGNEEITLDMDGSVSFPGNNQANTLSCNIKAVDLQNSRLFNKEIKFYLNYGSDDGTPIFRGFIKDVNPSDTKISIKAIDPRSLINSQNSKLVEITDENNYDGYSLAAFLQDFIDTEINSTKTLIGLSLLRDTNPSVSMSGVRNEPTPAYQIVSKKLKEAIDDSDIEKPLAYFIDVIDDGNQSNITFVKEKQPSTTTPSLSLSHDDGIVKFSYNRRAPVNYGTAAGATFAYGNAPLGAVGMSLSGEFKDRNEGRQKLIKNVLLGHREVEEIQLQSTKGHYLNLGSIIKINVDKEDIDGNHRLTSKSIKFSSSRVSLSLSLNKRPILLSEYL